MEIQAKIAKGGMQNGFDPKTAAKLAPSERDMVERRQKLLGPAYKLMYEHPVEFVRGEGAFLYDANGNKFLDCYNNVVSVGHCNKNVVGAVSKQLATLNTHTRYLSQDILDYSEQLLATFGETSNRQVMYTCTGSEAVDLSLRIAKFFTGGTGVIVTDYAYHGITAQVAAISSTMGPFVPLDKDVRMVRSPATGSPSPEEIGERMAADVQAAVEDMRRHGIKFAAFIADTLFSTDGLYVDPPRFLQPVIDKVHELGGLYIADEVQPGFGRTGEKIWGFQRHEIDPDLVVMGKPMGNGMPIAACVTKTPLLADFGEKARYFNTFGGNPVCIAAARATLNEIQTHARENARVVGKYILDGMRKIQREFPDLVSDVRGVGMYFGFEFNYENGGTELARRVVGELRENRVLVSTTGQRSNVLKIRPLLILTQSEADVLLRELANAVAKCSGVQSPAATGSSLTDKQEQISVELATELLSSLGINGSSIKKLRGERDQNFLVQSAEGPLMVKFLHPSEDQETTEFQTNLLRHINENAPEIPIQKLVHSGRMQCGNEERAVRIVSYIDGTLMANVVGATDTLATQSGTWQLESKQDLGRIAGKVTAVLQSFPPYRHELLWDLQHAAKLRQYTSDPLMLHLLDRFESVVLPKFTNPALRGVVRWGLVHNDYNTDNIVLSGDPRTGPHRVTGLLDFGDAVYTPIVNDVAGGATYQLGVPGTEFLEGALAFIRGYDSQFPLMPDEVALIYDLIVSRLVMRTVLHTWRAQLFPENIQYILRNAEEIRANLALLLENEAEYRARIALFHTNA